MKPFAFAELLARIRVLLHRGQNGDPREITVGALSLDLVARRATRSGQSIELTMREFDLLAHLMRYEGRVVSRETLTRDVRKEPGRSTPLDNVIDVHMARLRRKIDFDDGTEVIHTLRGVGFMLSDTQP